MSDPIRRLCRWACAWLVTLSVVGILSKDAFLTVMPILTIVLTLWLLINIEETKKNE